MSTEIFIFHFIQHVHINVFLQCSKQGNYIQKLDENTDKTFLDLETMWLQWQARKTPHTSILYLLPPISLPLLFLSFAEVFQHLTM